MNLIRPQVLLANTFILKIIFSKRNDLEVKEFLLNLCDSYSDCVFFSSTNSQKLLLNNNFFSFFLTKFTFLKSNTKEDFKLLSLLMKKNIEANSTMLKKFGQNNNLFFLKDSMDGEKIDWIQIQVKQKKAYLSQMKMIVVHRMMRLLESSEKIIIPSLSTGMRTIMEINNPKIREKVARYKNKLKYLFNPYVQKFLGNMKLKKRTTFQMFENSNVEKENTKKRSKRIASPYPHEQKKKNSKRRKKNKQNFEKKNSIENPTEIKNIKLPSINLRLLKTYNTNKKMGFFQKIKKEKTRKKSIPNHSIQSILEKHKDRKSRFNKSSIRVSKTSINSFIYGGKSFEKKNRLINKKRKGSNFQAKKRSTREISDLTIQKVILFKTDLSFNITEELIEIHINKFNSFFFEIFGLQDRELIVDNSLKLSRYKYLIRIYKKIFQKKVIEGFGFNYRLFRGLFYNLIIMFYLIFDCFVKKEYFKNKNLIFEICGLIHSILTIVPISFGNFLKKHKLKKCYVFTLKILIDICIFYFMWESQLIQTEKHRKKCRSKVIVLGNSIVRLVLEKVTLKATIKVFRTSFCIFEIIFELFKKTPDYIPIAGAEFFSLCFHITLSKINSNHVANTFISYLDFLKKNTDPQFFIYLLTCSNFFFDLSKFENMVYAKNLSQRNLKVTDLSEIPTYFINEIYKLLDPSNVSSLLFLMLET